MAELTLDDVTKVFTEDDGNEITAVDEVSVDIEDGEFLVLVGPSGCGKSTTLRMIAGLETITTGEIRLAGRRINEKPPAERDIAMVFQSYALYPHMTVQQNMSFGLEESTEMNDDEIESKVADTAELMEIKELLDRKPSDLSGGQQQRVALGRAIVRAPEAFLMDEPLSNLDAKLRATMRTELQRIQDDLDVTTVYVTHDQTEAMTMGDRIAILNDGILQQVGTPLECYHTPNNRFVAGFIGDPSMNFFEMDVDGETLVIDRFEYPLKPAQQEAISGRSDVVFGIRPEDIRIKEPGGLSDNYQFEVTVDVVEPRGDENTIHLTFDRSVDDPVTFTATVSGLRNISAGDEVVATFPPDSIHLFDTDSGVAVHNRTFDSEDATHQVL
ncbi:sugar ABC transporter ATP-binding protein [Halonotius aquaticus]|uniref:ABC-type D-xylose/L-arabinose transporter n=1 Tax=Halonotius aquaticus TaxID=2216978 RepID=A0A3A6QEK7_9EURY|nr:ABC transporter ATP-binding protein [Halonotius aquaticus]RJX45140.1 sugar ABC transporter ATP-binding protein [Halonotius aquaticus]